MTRTLAQILADQKTAWRTLGPDPKPKDPTMGAMLIKAAIPAIIEYIEKARKAAPAFILASITGIVAWLPSSVEKATLTFRSLYTRAITLIGAWLPTQVAPVTAIAGKVLDRAVVFLKKQG